MRCNAQIGYSSDSLGIEAHTGSAQIGYSSDTLEINGAACAIICH